MNEAGPLQRLWSLDAPPVQDAVFLFAVLQRIERRGFRMNMGLLALHSLAAAWVCWLLWPTFKRMVAASIGTLDGAMTPLAIILVLVAMMEFHRVSGEP